MAVAVKPSNSLINIRSSIKSVRSSFSGLKKKTGKLNNILLRKTKVKRESIARNYILSQRRQEGERRKNREDLIEASSIGGVIKRQAKAIASSTKGFLGRIMDFLGTLLVGWLLYNLPSIITMAQELIARMQRLSTIVSGFFNNTVSIFRGFGNVLGAIGKNILTFDFTDSNKRVENAVKGLGNTFDDMQSQFDEGFRLLTTSLGEGIVSGEDAKPTGTKYENESMQEPSTPSGSPGSGGGKWKPLLDLISSGEGGYTSMYPSESYPQMTNMTISEVIAFQKQKLKDGRASAAVGRYQMLYPESYAKNAGIPLTAKFSPANQDKMAASYIEKKRRGSDWLSGKITDEQFSEELAHEWGSFRSASGFVLPRNSGAIGFDKLKPTLKKVKSSPVQTQSAPPTPPPAAIQPGKKLTGGDILTKSLGKGVQYIEITSGYGSRGGGHMGLDIAAPEGTYIALRYDCEVVAAGTYGNYGNLMDVWIPQLGIQLRMAHLSAILIKSGKIKSGTSFARVGSTGRSTGPHIHLEYSTQRNSSNYGGSGDPSPYVSALLLTKNPNQGSFGIPSQAQIAPQGTQQRQQVSQQLKQQKNGPTIVVIEEDPPAQQQVSAGGGGGGGMIPIIINPLNSFITKKLLLDLAYT
jgi:murein DD-endopeptidase MepM/ murein hydrolase activator NlpD